MKGDIAIIPNTEMVRVMNINRKKLSSMRDNSI